MDSANGTIKMAAVGRRFALGQLYDYRTDSILSDSSPWDRLKEDKVVVDHAKIKTSQCGFQEWSCRLQHGKLNDHLKASVLADLIGKYRGASRYLVDECDLSQAVRTLRVCYKQKTEKINLDKAFDLKCVVDSSQVPEGATHVVTAVQYGVESFSLFSCSVDEAKVDVEEELQRILKDISDAVEDEADESEFKERFGQEQLVQSIHCKHYADLQSAAREIKFFDFYKVIRKLLTAGQSVPLVVVLHPLDRLLPDRSVVRWTEIDDDALHRCIDTVDLLSRSRTRAQLWLKEANVKMFHQFRSSLRRFIDCTDKFQKRFQNALKKAVVEARSASPDKSDECAVARVADVAAESAFTKELIDQWLQYKSQEMEMLKTIGQVDDVSLIESRTKLDAELFTLKVNFTAVFYLPCLERKDPILEALTQYIDNNNRLVRYQPEITPIRSFTWNQDRHQFVKCLRQFAEFSRINKKDGQLAFLVTSLLSQEDTGLHVALYKDGECVVDDFQVPSKPEDLTLAERTTSHITVQWRCQRSKDVTAFLVQYKEESSVTWNEFRTRNNETRAAVPSSASVEKICIRVAAVTLGGRSDFSAVLELAAPRKFCQAPAPSVLDVTHNSVELEWSEPVHDADMTIQFYSVTFHPEEQPNDVKVVNVIETRCFLQDLLSGQSYSIQVSADCGADGVSLPSAAITRATSLRPIRPAEWLLDKCQTICRRSGTDLLQIPLQEETSSRLKSTRRFSFGRESVARRKTRKTILMMGATGSGKTTLINAMVNYILGVERDDPFRFQLIDEQVTASQAHSQTTLITAYDIHWMPGMRIDYSLTIIDTPGYGDTKGLQRDKDITKSIRKFFQDPHGIQEVDVVGFVLRSSSVRLTANQKYIFDSVLQIFGKDIKDNIHLLITFADNSQPPVIAAVLEAQVPCLRDATGQPVFHRFNNSAFTFGQVQLMDEFSPHFWNMGVDNFRSFLAQLVRMESKSLTLTREVLEERKRLETTVEGLQQLIRRDLGNVDEISKVERAILVNEAQINAHANVQIEVNVMEPKKELVPEGHFLTNCSKCHVTCHYPCGIPKDENKAGCWAMTDGRCRICPLKCIWNVHFNQPYKWEYVGVMKKIESEEVRQKYEHLLKKKLNATELAEALKRDQTNMAAKVFKSVKKVTKCILQLEKIALRPSAFTTTEYIDLMINSERQEKQPGFTERIQSLRQLRDQVQLIKNVRDDRPVRPSAADRNTSGDRSASSSSSDDDEPLDIRQQQYSLLFD